MVEVSLTINGSAHALLVDDHETLLDTLRERLSLTGSKRGCDEGSCGACTVILDGIPVLACLTAVQKCHGRQVTTIEGVASSGQLHPLQSELVEHGAVQCGFCTPGMVMAGLSLVDTNSALSEGEVREALSGNMCRCTGYAKIVSAVQAAAGIGEASHG